MAIDKLKLFSWLNQELDKMGPKFDADKYTEDVKRTAKFTRSDGKEQTEEDRQFAVSAFLNPYGYGKAAGHFEGRRRALLDVIRKLIVAPGELEE